MFKAHRILYHSALGLRVIKKRRRTARSVLVVVLHGSMLAILIRDLGTTTLQKCAVVPRRARI